MTEFIPEDAMTELSNDGIRIAQKPRTYPGNYIIEINKLIQDRINNCKSLLPEWLNWEYVKDIFIMSKPHISREGRRKGKARQSNLYKPGRPGSVS